jgi:hypothetical protein
MPRPRAACGSFAAYKRHKRLHETVDAACAEAARRQAQDRRDAAAGESAEVLQLALARTPPPPEELDEVAELRKNLRLVTAALDSAPASSVVALSVRQQELVSAILRLQRGELEPSRSRLDDIVARRSRRQPPDGPRAL